MLPPFDSDALILGAQAARAFIQTHRIAYAQIMPDLHVGLASHNFGAVLTKSGQFIQDQPLSELFQEFVGAEDVLRSILAGTESSFNLEHINRDLPDGTVLYLNFRVLPLDEHNPGDGLLLVVEDVTDFDQMKQNIVQDRNELRLAKVELEHANQELERLSRFKSFMLSMAAHDIRNFLNVMMLYMDKLRGDLPPDSLPKQLHSLGMIDSQITNLGRIFNNLLSLDQAEQGKLSVQFIRCDLNRLLHSTLGDMGMAAKSNELRFDAEIEKEPLLIEADPERIKQIIYNLIGNAIKYTPKGGRVLVTLNREDGQPVLKVSDTGRGMSPEQVSHIFQLYYRTEEAEKSQVTGSGLGLYITQTLIEAHHGNITVTSQIGQGSTFTVRLPFHQPKPL